jgi:hypothetical protein
MFSMADIWRLLKKESSMQALRAALSNPVKSLRAEWSYSAGIGRLCWRKKLSLSQYPR